MLEGQSLLNTDGRVIHHNSFAKHEWHRALRAAVIKRSPVEGAALRGGCAGSCARCAAPSRTPVSSAPLDRSYPMSTPGRRPRRGRRSRRRTGPGAILRSWAVAASAAASPDQIRKAPDRGRCARPAGNGLRNQPF